MLDELQNRSKAFGLEAVPIRLDGVAGVVQLP
jgi:hypothetical protein